LPPALHPLLRFSKIQINGSPQDFTMTSKFPGIISNLLRQLHGHGYFRPETGPLKVRLTEAVLDTLESDALEQLSEQPIDLEVSIGCQEGEDEVTIGISVQHPDLSHTTELALTALAEDALEDLAGYLTRLVESAAPGELDVPDKAMLRKKMEAESHEQTTASTRLKVSPQWLKSVIPCTDYSYDEIDGKKFIREYYWSKELIERLFKIKCTKTTPEDLQYVAKECCEGDLDWARDLIARLKSPNRVEQPPREQTQRNQPKTPAKAAVPNKAAAPNERTRSRSRNKKPREAGKDARKSEPASGAKPPAN
jgi:hypothetical protein